MSNKRTFGRKGWTPERLGDLTGKTYVITGTTTGTGYEATKILLSKGAKVVMLNRNATNSAIRIREMKKEFGPKADVSFIHFDLSMMQSVRRAAEEVIEKVPQIDALIVNAAISQIHRQEITIDGFESHLGVNYYGHFLLVGLLFKRIEESKGRVVVMGSASYNMGLKRIKFEDMNFDEGYNAWNPYAHSKLACMMFGYELQRRVATKNSPVQVQVCHPGASKTDLLKGENLHQVTKRLWKVMAPIIAQSGKKGSYPMVMCATEDGLKQQTLYGPIKRQTTVGPVDEHILYPQALDKEASTKLWKLSEEKVSLKWTV